MQPRFTNLMSEFKRHSSNSKSSNDLRRLGLETLETREMLSATTWQPSVAADSALVASTAVDAPISLATLDVSVEKIEATHAAIGSNKANIEWTSVDGASKYYLMACTSTDGENYGAWTGLKYVNDPGDGSDTVSTKLTLTAGKYYQFKVRAIIGDDTTDYAETEEAIVVNKPESPEITSAAVDRSTGIATLEFDTIDNASFYRVDYTFDDGATWQFAKYIYVGEGDATSSKIYIDADADSAVLTHKLNANKTYQFRVRATNDCGSSEYVQSESISYKGATAPEWVKAEENVGTHYATISWAASDDATEYIIESTTNAGESWSGVKKATADAFTYDEATNSYSYSYFISTNKTYQFRVRAYNDLGTDGGSTVSEEVALSLVGTPENFTITSAEAVNPTNYPIGERYSKVTLTLSWDAVDNATKYIVKYSKDGGELKQLKNINDPSVTSMTFGAVAGSYYNFSIMAVNAVSTSEVESGVFGVYKAALNRVDVVAGETLEATNAAPSDVTSVYKWQYRTATGEWTDIDGVVGSKYTPSTEDVANKYWIRVLVSGTDESCPGGRYTAEAVAGPVVEAVNAPSDFLFGTYDPETHKLQMSWTDNSYNEDGFYVEYSADAGQTWAKAAWLDANVTERTGTVYEDNSYQFRVRAYNASGYSAWAYSDTYDFEDDQPDTPSLCVTTADDVVNAEDGLISLREAILYASQYSWPSNEITFDSKLNGQTITLTQGELVVDQELTFNASGQNITVSGNNKSRVFYVTSTGVEFDGLTFTQGNAEDDYVRLGGAVYVDEFAEVKFNDCVFTKNAAVSGAGVYVASDATTNFDRCSFSENKAEDGGGVYVDYYGNAKFNASVFTNNNAEITGGAVVVGMCADTWFTNSVFSGNSAQTGGAFYALDYCYLTLYHTTVVNNSATTNGGGLTLISAEVALYNSIIYGNTSAQTGANIWSMVSTIDANYNLTYSANGGWDNAGSSVTNANPVEMANNTSLSRVLNTTTFRPVSGSAAIDAGLAAITPDVTTDLAGNPRDSKPDLGAYEYTASASALLDDVFADLTDDLDIDWTL